MLFGGCVGEREMEAAIAQLVERLTSNAKPVEDGLHKDAIE